MTSQDRATPPLRRYRGTLKRQNRTRPSPFSSPGWTISMRTSPCSITRRSAFGTGVIDGCSVRQTSSGVASTSNENWCSLTEGVCDSDVTPATGGVLVSAAMTLLHPAAYARERPDPAALVMAGSGEVVTYRQLDERSNRMAHALRAHGLGTGDHIAILMENNRAYLEVAWAAQRAGLYYTAINSHLRPGEVHYILDDSGRRRSRRSRRAGRCCPPRAPPAGPRACASDCPPPRWATLRRRRW